MAKPKLSDEMFVMVDGKKQDAMIHDGILDDPRVDMEIVCAPSVQQWINDGFTEAQARSYCGLPPKAGS